MHLAVQQGVDKINSLQADLLLSEEVDVELNKSMSRFINLKYGINNKYRKGFEESQKRIDDLRTLVTEFSNTVTYKEQYSNKIWVDTFRLPADYLYLVSQRSEVAIDRCKPVTFSLASSGNYSYFLIPFTNLHNGGSAFVDRMRMAADPATPALGDVSMLDMGGADKVINDFYNYPSDNDALIADIQDPLNWGVGFQWYWESYDDLNVPDSFIVIVDINTYPWFNYDAAVTNVVSGISLVTQAVGNFATATSLADPINSTIDSLYNDLSSISQRLITPSSTTSIDMTLNKFVQQDDIAKLLTDPFNTTKYTSPLTTIRNYYIDIYTSDIFIIQKVKITYIRKPREISLSLGVSCELPIHAHQEIVDMTASSILEGISDPRYKTASGEANKNE